MDKENNIRFYKMTTISSIISGMIAKLICHPIDTIKSIM